MMQIVDTISVDLEALEQNLLLFSHSDLNTHNEIARHLFTAGGKRVRPAVFLLCARLLSFRAEVRHAVAAALEYIHTASLLHDDVIDEAKVRRRRPTVNVLWDNTTAILTGDRIHALASRLMVRTGNLELIERVAQCIQHMSESEIHQLEVLWNPQLTEESYLRILGGKTAALFEVTAIAAPLLAELPAAQVDAFRIYGFELGLAFQIADDCLDFEGETQVVGKPLLSDLVEGKVTLPLIRALRSSHAAVPDLAALVEKICTDRHATPEQMERLRRLTQVTGGVESARSSAREHAQKACDTLRAATVDLRTTPEAQSIVDALLSVPTFSIERLF